MNEVYLLILETEDGRGGSDTRVISAHPTHQSARNAESFYVHYEMDKLKESTYIESVVFEV